MPLLHSGKNYKLTKFKTEAELEAAVVLHAKSIFGKDTIYLNIKKRVSSKNSTFTSIPDGYVIDFSSNPKLWVVENELSTHDTYKHVGAQLLKFATHFSEGSQKLKELIHTEIKDNPEIKQESQKFTKKSQFESISEVLDYLIYRNEFGFVVVIDEATQDLYQVTRELNRQPEILEIKKYTSGKEIIYQVDQLLAEVEESKSSQVKDIRDLDTIVCPAKPEGFKLAFKQQKAWWAVRISSSMLSQLKYIAMYEVSPVSAIRWAGKIQSIKPYEDTGKYKLYLSEIFKVGPIEMKNPKYSPQGPRYTNFHLLEHGKRLGEVF